VRNKYNTVYGAKCCCIRAVLLLLLLSLLLLQYVRRRTCTLCSCNSGAAVQRCTCSDCIGGGGNGIQNANKSRNLVSVYTYYICILYKRTRTPPRRTQCDVLRPLTRFAGNRPSHGVHAVYCIAHGINRRSLRRTLKCIPLMISPSVKRIVFHKTDL